MENKDKEKVDRQVNLDGSEKSVSLADEFSADIGRALNSRTSTQALKEGFSKAIATIRKLETQADEYKALGVEANTQNIGIGQENRILNNQIRDQASQTIQKIEIDKQIRRDEYAEKAEEEELKRELSNDFKNTVVKEGGKSKQY